MKKALISVAAAAAVFGLGIGLAKLFTAGINFVVEHHLPDFIMMAPFAAVLAFYIYHKILK